MGQEQNQDQALLCRRRNPEADLCNVPSVYSILRYCTEMMGDIVLLYRVVVNVESCYQPIDPLLPLVCIGSQFPDPLCSLHSDSLTL